MRCPDGLELQSYLDEELPLARAERVRTHLEHCFECRRSVTEMQGIKSLLRQTFPAAAIPRNDAPAAGRGWLRPAAAAAVVLFVLLGSGVWYFKATERPQWTPEAELLNQYMTIYMDDCSS